MSTRSKNLRRSRLAVIALALTTVTGLTTELSANALLTTRADAAGNALGATTLLPGTGLTGTLRGAAADLAWTPTATSCPHGNPTQVVTRDGTRATSLTLGATTFTDYGLVPGPHAWTIASTCGSNWTSSPVDISGTTAPIVWSHPTLPQELVDSGSADLDVDVTPRPDAPPLPDAPSWCEGQTLLAAMPSLVGLAGCDGPSVVAPVSTTVDGGAALARFASPTDFLAARLQGTVHPGAPTAWASQYAYTFTYTPTAGDCTSLPFAEFRQPLLVCWRNWTRPGTYTGSDGASDLAMGSSWGDPVVADITLTPNADGTVHVRVVMRDTGTSSRTCTSGASCGLNDHGTGQTNAYVNGVDVTGYVDYAFGPAGSQFVVLSEQNVGAGTIAVSITTPGTPALGTTYFAATWTPASSGSVSCGSGLPAGTSWSGGCYVHSGPAQSWQTSTWLPSDASGATPVAVPTVAKGTLTRTLVRTVPISWTPPTYSWALTLRHGGADLGGLDLGTATTPPAFGIETRGTTACLRLGGVTTGVCGTVPAVDPSDPEARRAGVGRLDPDAPGTVAFDGVRIQAV